MPTLKERFADALLGDERRKLERAASVFAEAYQRGPRMFSPEQLVAQLAEMDSRYLDFLARQIRNRTSIIGTGESTEVDRLAAVDASRHAYDTDVVTEAVVRLWTDYGYGVTLQVIPRAEAAREWWNEFWTAPRNSYLLSTENVHELSRQVLCDGDFLFLFFISTLDGSVTLRTVPTTELVGGPNQNGVITLPDDLAVPVYYRRQFRQADGSQGVAYYRDWRATDAQAEAALPADGYGGHKASFDDGPLAQDKAPANTVVVAYLVAHHRRGLRGWPLMTTGQPWAYAYKTFLEDRATIQKASATYFDKVSVKGGQRAVDALVATLTSSLTMSGSGYERNPQPPAGSSWLQNEQVNRERFPMNTGAGDAETDGAAILAQAGLAGGVFPHYLGRGEAFRLATANAMEGPTLRAFNRYQLFWSATWGNVVRIVLGAWQKYGNGPADLEDYKSDVSTDALLTADIATISKFIDTLATSIEKLGATKEQAQVILPHVIRLALQSLGIHNIDDVMQELEKLPKPEPEPTPAPAQQPPAPLSPAAQSPAQGGAPSPEQQSTQQEADSPATIAEARPFGPTAYRNSLRQAVRALWAGDTDAGGFADMMGAAIRRGITDAWYAGAEETGIKAEEMSVREVQALQSTISDEYGYVSGFAEAIEASSKAAGGKFTAFDGRLDQWAQRWDEVRMRAHVMAAGDKKYRWGFKPESQHCEDCPRLDGKVKRGSDWEAAGLFPRNGKTQCSIGCTCELTETDEPISRGPLPRIGG